MSKKLFLSIVSSEFVSCRKLLTQDLKRPDLDVAAQEDFGVTDGTTLEKLDDYIRQCEGVIHLIGKATGAVPEEPAVAALLAAYPDFAQRLPPLAEPLRQPQPGFSYTQWEAYLAIYHRRPLFIYLPTDFAHTTLEVPRADRFTFNAVELQSQKDHCQRISALGHDRGQFLNEERLSSAVLRDLVEILPRLESGVEVRATRLTHTAERLIGRDEDLTRLDAAWNDPHKNVVIVRAFGGMGKTSLVATWMAELALKDWRGAERVFDWSFYSQGTNDQRAASADTFIADALRAFGDPDPTLGSAWDRGARLAQLVGKVRCLLVLDGLEPLQYPPGPMEGKLKDAGIEALLKGLVAHNAGLCVVTTREKVDDIKQHYGRTADDLLLIRLSDLAGASLLHYAGARRAGAQVIAPDDRELQAASRELRGHGLTLQLLGQYLRLVEDGDILRRDTVRLADAEKEYQNDATRPYGHAFKAMEAYEKWFAGAGELGQRQLAVLRLLGLFDRPASRSCLEALRAEPVIAGLTEPLFSVVKKWFGLRRIFDPIPDKEWKLALSRLEEINMLAVQTDGSLDAHPLLREYFARQLRDHQPAAWRTAHRRLYEHLCATAPKSTEYGWRDELMRFLGFGTKEAEPTLEDLEPLYRAVAHGCKAGLQRQALQEVGFWRIQRGTEEYPIRKLGAFGSSVGALACFFDEPWNKISSSLKEAHKAWVLISAAICLRAVGRLNEAGDPMRKGLEMWCSLRNWKEAAVAAYHLSDLELSKGNLEDAIAEAEHSVEYADKSGNAFLRRCLRSSHADALHQAGRPDKAEKRFNEAHTISANRQLRTRLKHWFPGFQYYEFLLAKAERGAWGAFLRRDAPRVSEQSEQPGRAELECCWKHASDTLTVADVNKQLLDIALDHLALGRVALYVAIFRSPLSDFKRAGCELEDAVSGLRRAGQQPMLPHALLTRAWLRNLTGARTGPESAQIDLDEALEIAERGPMPLHLADIHLHRARLFFRETPYPWNQNPDGTARGPADDLAAARRLIEKHGYWRRKEELEDAEAAILPRG
jgi:tetratricopeptide (TPR) repeat protein